MYEVVTKQKDIHCIKNIKTGEITLFCFSTAKSAQEYIDYRLELGLSPMRVWELRIENEINDEKNGLDKG